MTTINRIIPTDARGALDAELKTALGTVYQGMSGGKYGIEVHFAKTATPDDENTATQIVLTFDTSKRLPEQIERAEKKQARDAARAKAQASKATKDDVIEYLRLQVEYLSERLGDS